MNIHRFAFIIGLIALLVCLCSCFHSPVEPNNVSENYSLFRQVWELYESDYPEFTLKGVDWKEAFYTYSIFAEEAVSYEDIVREAILPMLAELRDRHIFMYDPSGTRCFPQWSNPPINRNYDFPVLYSNYLLPAGFSGFTENVGFCDPELLPYFVIDSWGDSCNVERAREYVELCEGVPAIIIDVRMNSGGNSWIGRDLAGCFTSSTELAFFSRGRDGPGYDDVNYLPYYTFPNHSTFFEGEVYLLIGRECASATETFTLFLNCLENVTVIGDTTNGAAAFCYTVDLVGGWAIRAPGWSLRTVDKEPVESFGIPPDIYVEATKEDFAHGIDPVLEYAIDLVNSQSL